MEKIHDNQSKISKRKSGKKKKELSLREVSWAKQSREQHHRVLLDSLPKRTHEDLIMAFLVEREAENEAYYFILEGGYFEEFRQYNKAKP